MPDLFYRLALLLAITASLSACASTPPPAKPAAKPSPPVKAPVRFTNPVTTLSGQVLKATDQTPIAGVKILTFPATVVVTTDSAGHFSLTSAAFRADIEYSLTFSWRGSETTIQTPPVRLGESRLLAPILLEEAIQAPYIDDIDSPSPLDEGPEYPTLTDPD